MKKLNKKQERFCTFYSQTLNGQKSAELAGYAKGSARITASKLLTQANIKAKIAELLSNARAQAELSLVDMLNNLKSIVTATMADTSRTSLIIDSSVSLEKTMASTYSSCSLLSSVLSNSLIMLNAPFIGVLIS